MSVGDEKQERLRLREKHLKAIAKFAEEYLCRRWPIITYEGKPLKIVFFSFFFLKKKETKDKKLPVTE